MFDIVWVYDIFILEICHIFSIIFSLVFLTYIYLNARKSILLYHYLILHGILLVWLIAKVFKTIAPTADIKWVFIVIQYFAVCFLGSVFLMFAYLYAKGKTFSPVKIILINTPPTFFFLVVITNAKHQLFYSTYDFLGDTFGPLFYAYMICTYLYLIAGIYLCATCFKKQFSKKKIQARLFIVGIMFPLFVNVLYVSGITEPRFDITPVTTNISLLFFAYAIYKYQFLDIVPGGILLYLDRLKEGIMVVNVQGDILYSNNALETIMNSDKYGNEFKTVTDVDSRIEEMSGQSGVIHTLINERNKGVIKRKEIFFSGPSEKYFALYMKLLTDKKISKTKYLFVFSDITIYKDLISSLEEKNTQLKRTNDRIIKYKQDLKRLALVEERNRIAGEIHDVLGHSLTLILNILESSYILLDTDRPGAIKKIKLALSEAKMSIRKMSNIFQGEEKSKTAKTIRQLKLSLVELADRFRSAGMNVKLDISGCNNNIKPELFYTIIKISEEALTNSLKHGQAEIVNIIIRFNLQGIDIFIVDNGNGCKVFEKGNGLKDMKERIKNIAGSFSCGSPEGTGFTIHAKIPV